MAQCLGCGKKSWFLIVDSKTKLCSHCDEMYTLIARRHLEIMRESEDLIIKSKNPDTVSRRKIVLIDNAKKLKELARQYRQEKAIPEIDKLIAQYENHVQQPYVELPENKHSAQKATEIQPIYKKPEIEEFAHNKEWRLTVEFMDTKSSSFSQILKQANNYPGFSERWEDNKNIYSISFKPKEILDFDNIYKKIKGWKSVIVFINDQIIDLTDINKWLRRYRDKLKYQLSNPLFCYGASPFTFNLFGCHRTMIRDAYPESTDNWYEFGEMRKDGIFMIDKETIKRKIVENLKSYWFCPALSKETLTNGFAWIPDEINPKIDKSWQYVYIAGSRIPVGVIPCMTEFVIDEQQQTISTISGQINIRSGLHWAVTVTPHFKCLMMSLRGIDNSQVERAKNK